MKKHDAEKQTKIELLLRTDEVADILYEAIRTSERQKLDWLVDVDSEMHEDALSDEISKVKSNLRERAYADAAQANITRCRSQYGGRAASRKWLKVAAASLVALMIIGGGFTESGRAFAQEAYAVITNWINGVFSIRQGMHSEESVMPLNYSGLPETFESIEDAAEFLQRPVVVIESDLLTMVDIQTFKADGISITLQTTYSLQNENTVIVWQDCYDPTVQSYGVSTQAEEHPEKYTLENGLDIYYGEDGFGEAYAQVVYPYGHVFISGSDLNLETLQKLLPQISFK